MSLVVRKADLDSSRDAESIVALLNEYAEHEMGGGAGLSDFSKANLIDALQLRQTCSVFLAYVGDKAAGLVICFEGFSTFQCRPILNIHDVVVSAEFRGLKICKDLFQLVEKFALDSGCCKLTLEVLEGNRIAKRAYETMGFQAYELDPLMGRALFYEKLLG